MTVYHLDTAFKINYNPVINKVRFARRGIGPQELTLIPEVDWVHSNSNAVYVDPVSGLDVYPGTQANPKKTLTSAANYCNINRTRVVVLVSGNITEELGSINNVYFSGIYAAVGVVAYHTHRVINFTPSNSNSIFVKTTGSISGTGTRTDPNSDPNVAVTLLDGSHTAIVFLDSESYSMNKITMSGNFKKIVADYGCMPTITITEREDDITYCSVYEQVKGKTSLQVPTGISSRIVDTKKLSNGNIAVLYQYGRKTGDYLFWMIITVNLYTDIYDKDGNLIVANIDCGMIHQWVASDGFGLHYDFKNNFAKLIPYASGGFTVVHTALLGGLNAGTWNNDGTVYNEKTMLQISTADFGGLTGHIDAVPYNDNFIVYSSTGRLGCWSRELIPVYPVVIETGLTSEYQVGLVYMPESTPLLALVYSYSGTIYVDYRLASNGNHSAGAYATNHTATDYICATLSNLNPFGSPDYVYAVAIAGRDTGDSNKGKFSVVCGDQKSALRTFEAGRSDTINVISLLNGTLWISYEDYDDSRTGKYVIASLDGTIRVGPAAYEYYIAPGSANQQMVPSAALLNNGNVFLAWSQNYDANLMVRYSSFFMIRVPYYYSPISVTTDALIDGIIIDFENKTSITKAIEVTGANLSLYYNMIKNLDAYILAMGYLVYGNHEVDFQNNIFADIDGEIFITSNTVNISRNAFYRFNQTAVHIDGAGAGIVIEHNTIYKSLNGIKLENNDGDESVNNNILFSNSGYDIYADVEITVEYSIITGNVHNATSGQSIVDANPLFLNVGDLAPDDIDLRLKRAAIGDSVDSPAILLADDTPDCDAGAYDDISIGTPESWTSVIFDKPTRINIKYIPVGAINDISDSGNPRASVKAFVENIEIPFDGMETAQYESLRAIIQCGNPTIQFYPDYITNPATFFIYTLFYQELKGSPAGGYKLLRSGINGAALVFQRKYTI